MPCILMLLKHLVWFSYHVFVFVYILILCSPKTVFSFFFCVVELCSFFPFRNSSTVRTLINPWNEQQMFATAKKDSIKNCATIRCGWFADWFYWLKWRCAGFGSLLLWVAHRQRARPSQTTSTTIYKFCSIGTFPSFKVQIEHAITHQTENDITQLIIMRI